MNRYDKYYFERYALLSICYFLNLEINEFEHKDKPDLQSNVYDIGFEVVRAITTHDGLTESLANAYFGKGLSGEEIVAAINQGNTKGKFKGSVFSINGTAVISDTKGLYDTTKHKDLAIEKINEKSALSRKYTRFGTNGLYCFEHTGMIDDHHYPEIVTACENSAFSIIIINCMGYILQWKRSSEGITRQEVPAELLVEWKQLALNKSDC